jgi:hypothetical protein
MYTEHAEKRLQQRGISRDVCELLLAYGDEKYDGHGGCIRFFSERSVARLNAECGLSFCKKHIGSFRTYLVQSTRDGAIITVGLDRVAHKFKALRVA